MLCVVPTDHSQIALTGTDRTLALYFGVEGLLTSERENCVYDNETKFYSNN